MTLAVIAVLITVTGGFCVFDTDPHGHDGVGLDLCTTILALVMTVLIVVLGAVGSATARAGWAATPVAVAVLDPPPWRASSV